MTTTVIYQSDRQLFSTWNQTQALFFKKCMENIKLDFFKAGTIFSKLADELNRLPTFEEFERKYNEKNN